MNITLRNELIQTAGLANRAGYDTATDFLLNAVVTPTNGVPEAPIGQIDHSRLVDAILCAYRGPTDCGANKIFAIKMYRALTGSGLKESKDWVEACLEANAHRLR